MTPDGPDDALIVVPLIRLPAERTGGDVEAQKEYIREKILGRDNKTLADDKEAWKLLCELGGDLMINAFATNFRIDGKVNQDVVSSNPTNLQATNTGATPACVQTLTSVLRAKPTTSTNGFSPSSPSHLRKTTLKTGSSSLRHPNLAKRPTATV
jgi:hypothetical protein